MFTQNLVLAAVAVSGVYAQSTASGCSAATATVNSAADATALSSCSTISGDVVVGPNAAGIIDLSGPEAISGSLIVSSAGQLVTLRSDTIGTIGDSFTLDNLTILSTVNFGSLTGVGQLSFSALPALPQLTFPSFISKAKSVLITNTFLSTLDGINLESVDTLDINNNNRLRTFSTQVANITQNLNIESNGRNLDVTFPNLEWAANMTLKNISTISFPSLAVINGSLGFYGNYFESINAPNLTSISSGSLAIVANPSLTNVSMPLLEAIGGANTIANNSALDAISFPVLANVGGAIDFSGNFTTPELPALNDVKGGFNMQSTAEIDCSGFQKEKDSGAVQGKFTCKTTAEAASDPDNTSSGSGTSTGSGSSSSSTASSNAAVQVGFNAPSAIGLSVVGGFLGMLL